MPCTRKWLLLITILATISKAMADVCDTPHCSDAHCCFRKTELANLFTYDNSTMAYCTLKRLTEAANMPSRFNELDFAYMCFYYPLKYYTTDMKHWQEMSKWCKEVVEYYDFYEIIQPIQSLLCDIRPKPEPATCPCLYNARSHISSQIHDYLY